MKNWKRFIAACLSVTMIASTPLTAFAESSVSVDPMMLQSELNSTEEVKATEFEKILTHKTPYEYFANQKEQQSILDSLKDEELFQLKELMKYAYVHESSTDNRQSLDAYMLILENWKKRDVQYEEEQEKKLVQDVIEKSSIYDTAFDDKKVVDLPSYMEYLQSIKKFDVARYVEVLTGLEKAKNDEDLKKAKEAFEDFENQVYGFKEQVADDKKAPQKDNSSKKEHSEEKKSEKTQVEEKQPKKEQSTEEKAVDRMLEDGQYIKVYYLLYDKNEDDVFSNFVVHSPYEILEDGTLRAVINAHPDTFDYNNGGKIPIDVDINRGAHDGKQVPITEQCTYNEKEGYVDIPAEHAKKDLTVTVWQSRDSDFYKGLPDEFKPQEDRREIEMFGIFNDFFPSGTIPTKFAANGCNIVTLDASIDSVSVGQSWSAQGTTWYIANNYNADSWIWSDVAGADVYDKYFSQGQIINITSCDNPIFKNIGGAGPESKNWLFTGCLSSVSNNFAGVPLITQMNIECIAKDGKTATFFMRAKCKGPKNQSAQTVGGFFKATMRDTYRITYDGNGGLYGGNPTWSENVTYGTDYTTWDNFFTKKGYRFTGWNTKPDGTGSDWTPWIGKPWKWTANYNVTLYAQWEPYKLRVHYYSNGGVWTGENSGNSVAGKNQYIKSWDFPYNKVDNHYNYGSFGLTKKGHYTDGYWGTTTSGGILMEQDENLTGQQMAQRYGLDLSYGNKEINVYAHWIPYEFTNYVSHWLWGFENGEGTNGAKNAYRLKDNTSFKVKYNNNFTLDANKAAVPPTGTYLREFSSPNLSSDGSWINYPVGTKITQTDRNLSFEAGFYPINYSITYNLNGGTNNSSNPTSYNVLYGKSLSNPTKPGYVFKGWEENLFVDSRVVPEEGSSKNGSTHTFVNKTSGNTFGSSKIQIWDRDYKKFITQIATGHNGKVDVKYTHNLETGTYALRIGANGSTSDSCSHLMNVYFEKGKTYTISYNSSVTSSKVVMSNIKILDSNVTGINAGKNATFSSASVLYSELAKRKVENVVLTAKWAPITYTVKYNGNGATGGSTANSTHTYDVAKNLTANGFSRTGYTFKNWNTKPDGTGTSYTNQQSVKNLTSVNGGVVNLYAQWTKNGYYLDVNGRLDGVNNSGTTNFGTFDVYVDGVLKANDVADFYQAIPYGSKYEIKDIKAKTGKRYIGVYSGSLTGTIPASNVSATLEFKTNTYNVVFNGNGATGGSTATQGFVYGTAEKLNANGFTRTGYTFAGWNTRADGSGTAYSNQQSVNNLTATHGGTVTLYAQWKVHTYTIKYNGNGATSGTTADSIHTYNVAKNLTANGFSRIGHTFKNWNTKPDGTGTSYTNQQSVKNLTVANGAVITLYAQWTPNHVEIAYNPNGGKVSAAGTGYNSSGWITLNGATYFHKINYGAKSDPYNATTFGLTKTGYLFNGWKLPNGKVLNQDTEYDSTVYYQHDNANKTTANTSVVYCYLYADWKAATYTVKYNGNGATGGSTASSTHTYDVAKNLTANGFSRTGYTFTGWNTKPDGTGTTYANQQSVKNLTSVNGGVVNLYAQWKVNTYKNTISHWMFGFKNQEGNNSSKNAYNIANTTFNANYNSKFVLDASKKVTIPNGFYLINSFGTSSIEGAWKSYPFGTSVTQKPNNMTFEYDYYPTSYSITYNLNGGTNNSANPSSYNVLYGVSLKNPTRKGYTFAGWYNGNTKVTGINEGKNATFTSVDQMYSELSKRQTGNIALTAKWTPITYTVKYNGNGATGGSTASSTHTYDVAKALTANGFSKTGYTFTGWNTKSDGSGTAYKDKQSVKNLTSVNGGTVTLYAQWRVNKLYIQYNVNGGSFSSTNVNLTVDSQGYVLNSGTKNISIYNYGTSLTQDGLANWDNPNYINAKKTGYLAVEGKEWKATIDGQTKYFSDTTVYKVSDIADISKGDKTVVMYVNWTPKKLITTFHRNTSSTDTVTAQQTFTYDVAGQKFTDKGWSKTGYTLLGWSDSKTATTQQYSILSSVSNAWIDQHSPKNDVYAVWKANKYTVSYNANGGTGSMLTDTVTFDTAYTTRANGFSRTGYTFVGWNEKPDGSGVDWTSYIGKPWTWKYTKNVTLYAQWKINNYNLTVNPNGGTYQGSTSSKTTSVQYNSIAKVDTPLKTGYTFTGWNQNGFATNPTGALLGNGYAPDFSSSIGTRVIQRYEDRTHYELNGLTSATDTWAHLSFGPYSVKAGQTVTITGEINITSNVPSGLNFYHGAKSNDYGNNKLNIRSTTNGWKKFSITRTFTEDSNQAYFEIFTGTLKGTNNAKVAFDLRKVQIKDSTGANVYKDWFRMPANNVILTARWAPHVYTIKYDGNGATGGSTAASSHTYDVAKNLTANGFQKTGYTFTGWNTKPDGKGTAYANQQSVKNLTTTDGATITLYAQWKANTYTIKYDGNGATSGSTASSTHTYDVAKPLTPNGYHKDGYIFDGWNTKPDGSGTSYKDKEPVKNLTSTDKTTVTLYAKWKAISYRIYYKGNGSLSGKDQLDSIYQKDITANGGYVLKDNKGYTNFTLDKNTFKGWYSSSVVDTKEEMNKIYKVGTKLTLDVLQQIHADQVKNHIVTEKSPTEKDVVLYAVWDKAPGITIPDTFKDEFYEGTTVTRENLLKGIAASDKIDGDITKQIIITQIDYSAGRLNSTGKDKAYSQKWANGMPADAVLDTWFMKLDKKDSPVKHKITYQVKDSAGNVTTATKEVRVLYNEFPTIKANDKYYSLEKAQGGFITEDALLKDLITAGTLSAADTEEGNLSSKLELVDFDPSVFTSMKREGFVPITYRVYDSMGPNGKGKETLKTVYVHITAIRPGETVKYVRFINKDNYNKNAGLNLNAMTKQEIAMRAVNGGLHPKSKWYTDPAYKAVIMDAFNKTSGDVYMYTKEDIGKMREFVKQHGVGNAKESNGLDVFANAFMTGHYKK